MLLPFINPMIFQNSNDDGITTPTVVGNGGWVDNNSTTNPVNVPWPAGVAENDIAILQAFLAPPVELTINTPAGWTQIAQENTNVVAAKHAIFWKRLTGSESGTQTITMSGAPSTSDTFGGIINIFRGCKTTGTPYEAYATTNDHTANLTTSAITTLGDNRRVLCFGACYTLGTSTPAAGWTEHYDIQTNSGVAEGGVKLYSIEKASAGLLAAVNHPFGGSEYWRAFTLALIPN